MIQPSSQYEGIRVLDEFVCKAVPDESLSALSPPGRSTPSPVLARAQWDGKSETALISWQTSTDEDLAYYSIRTSPGPTYNAAEECVLGQVAKGHTNFSTNAGLATPGSEAVYRVYVVRNSGDETGSKTVKVIRPDS